MNGPIGRHSRLRLAAAVVGAGFLLSSVLPSMAFADPPPWAPAHVWRRKHQQDYVVPAPAYVVQPYPYYIRPQPYPVPFGIDLGRCNRDAVGAAIGGVAGGAIGAGVTDREHRAVGIIAGTVIGAITGGLIGKAMDDADYTCMGQAFEYAGRGQPVTWTDPNGTRYRVMPGESYERGGRYCRDYTTTAVIDGRAQSVTGEACRRPDGSWDL